MNRKGFAMSFVVFVMATIFLAGCSARQVREESPSLSEDQGTLIEFTDMEGRNIQIRGKTDRVVAIGSALRLYTYVAGTDRLVGVERGQQNTESARPYILANPRLGDLPIVGEGHPADPDPELLIEANPDVIIAGDIMDKSRLEDLEKKTGIPVVAVTCGDTAVFDKDTYEAIRIIGKTVGYDDRAQEVVDYMEACKDELIAMTEDLKGDEKPSVYVGGLSHKGVHGIESTASNSPLLDIIGARNVADDVSASGSIMIDREQLLEWDPDIIIIDENGLEIVREDFRKNPKFYNALTAIREGRMYGQLPYVAYYNNVETAIADIYYLGKIIYPDAFKDIDPAAKADEIYEFLLGMPLYDVMAERFGGFTQITLGE